MFKVGAFSQHVTHHLIPFMLRRKKIRKTCQLYIVCSETIGWERLWRINKALKHKHNGMKMKRSSNILQQQRVVVSGSSGFGLKSFALTTIWTNPLWATTQSQFSELCLTWNTCLQRRSLCMLVSVCLCVQIAINTLKRRLKHEWNQWNKPSGKTSLSNWTC